MEKLLISDIKVGSRPAGRLFIDEGFLLLDAACTFTSELQKALFDWGYKSILTEAKPKPVVVEEAGNGSKKNSQAIKKMDSSEFEDVSFDDFGVSFENKQKKEAPSRSPDAVQAEKTAAPKPAVNTEPPRPAVNTTPPKPVINTELPKPVINTTPPKLTENTEPPKTIKAVNLSAGYYSESESKNDKLDDAQKVYDKYLGYITKVYTRYATHKELNLGDLFENVKVLCEYIQTNKKYILRLTPNVSIIGKDFLISHAMRSAVFSIVIGLQMNLQFNQVVELGISAILHEIGQIRLPPQLYLRPRALSPNERAQLATHTVLGYNILKEKNFPTSMQLAVLEHHERENGTGYPRRLTGDKISLYAKIISVACSFEAITAPRNYKSSKNPFEAMVEMLQNNQKQYDDTVIKALLFSVSLYPIGAYILLSNGRIAQVTDMNQSDPRNPIVEIVGMKNEAGNPLQVQIDGIKLHIVKVLDKKELANYNIQR